MELQLVRNATLRLSYAGRELLVDPSLDPAGAWPRVRLLRNPRPNPMVELPLPAEEVVDGLDGVLLTHLHRDHFDDRARELIASDLPVLHQPPDARKLGRHAFAQLRPAPLARELEWLGLRVTAVAGRHGFGLGARLAGPVCGFVLRAPAEPTVYIAGDTVWCAEVEAALAAYRPDVTVLNAGDARLVTGARLIMDADDVERVLAAAPDTKAVAVHLEAISHCVATRSELERRFGNRLAVPADGDSVRLDAP